MKFETVDVIQANSTTGNVRPLRFRVHGKSINVDKILSVEHLKMAAGPAIVYEAESAVDGQLVHYRLTLDPAKRTWYVSRL